MMELVLAANLLLMMGGIAAKVVDLTSSDSAPEDHEQDTVPPHDISGDAAQTDAAQANAAQADDSGFLLGADQESAHSDAEDGGDESIWGDMGQDRLFGDDGNDGNDGLAGLNFRDSAQMIPADGPDDLLVGAGHDTQDAAQGGGEHGGAHDDVGNNDTLQMDDSWTDGDTHFLIEDFQRGADRLELTYTPVYDATGKEIPPDITIAPNETGDSSVISLDGTAIATLAGVRDLTLADLALVAAPMAPPLAAAAPDNTDHLAQDHLAGQTDTEVMSDHDSPNHAQRDGGLDGAATDDLPTRPQDDISRIEDFTAGEKIEILYDATEGTPAITLADSPVAGETDVLADGVVIARVVDKAAALTTAAITLIAA